MSFVSGGGTLEIKLLSYSNPKGEDINGEICDIWQWSSGCDHKFEFCLKENGSCVIPVKLSTVYDDTYSVNFK